MSRLSESPLSARSLVRFSHVWEGFRMLNIFNYGSCSLCPSTPTYPIPLNSHSRRKPVIRGSWPTFRCSITHCLGQIFFSFSSLILRSATVLPETFICLFLNRKKWKYCLPFKNWLPWIKTVWRLTFSLVPITVSRRQPFNPSLLLDHAA